MRLKTLALTAALSLGLALPAAAAPWVLDKSHAYISFTVDHLGYSAVRGHFRAFDAEIDFDPDAIEKTSLRFVIDAASVDTLWEARDNHIRSKDFLDVQNHPNIVFESTSVTSTGAETAEVTGNLTIRDKTTPITFQARLNKLAPSPFTKKQVAGFSVTGEIDRTAFGITYAAPAVGVTVPVEIELEMSPAE